MKLVAVSRVRNEADIIEAFVRHHAVHFNKLILLDDGSNDGTFEALRSLQAEGLPLVLLRQQVVGYEQSQHMTHLLHIAVHRFGADWVALLDADEFVEPEAGMTLCETLNGQEPRLLSLAWNNFLWSPEDDSKPESNPVVRQSFRLPPRSDLMKVLVPACLVDETTKVAQGNHGLEHNGEPVVALPLQSLNLGHFPIRSLSQYASKVGVGYLQYQAMPNWNGVWGHHYVEPFQALITGGLDLLRQRMPMDSRYYSYGEDALRENGLEAQHAPLRYQGGPLTQALSRSAFLQDILHCAEAIARDRAGASAEVDALRRQLDTVGQEQGQLIGDKAVLEKRLSRMELELLEARQQLYLQFEQLNSRTFKLLKRIHARLARAGLNPSTVIDRLWSLRPR